MNDMVVNVRQIMQYPLKAAAAPADAVLLQTNGLGGPYAYTPVLGLFGALEAPGVTIGVGVPLPPDAIGSGVIATNFAALIGAGYGWNWYQGAHGPSYLSTGAAARLSFDGNAFNFLTAPGGQPGGAIASWAVGFSVTASGYATLADTLRVGRDPEHFLEVATKRYTDFLHKRSVTSFNMRMGAVSLTLEDIVAAGGAPIISPQFSGCPTAPTIDDADAATCQIANAMWVRRVVNFRINDLLAGHPFVFRWNGRVGDVWLQRCDLEVFDVAFRDSPAFTGTPTAPTAPAGTCTEQIATTLFVCTAIANALQDLATGVVSFNGRAGVVTLTLADITAVGGAPIHSPAFSGAPSAPTAPPGTSTGQLATTAFVMDAISSSTAGVSSFNGRSGAVTLDLTDITDAGGAPLASPTFTGTPAGPTAAPGTSTTQLATTAFVMDAVAAATAGVSSFNGRTGAVTLQLTDITAAGGAPLASPALSGTPTAPTASPGTSTTQLATTAFVTAAIAAIAAGVSSFNGRTGAVTLNLNDITAAGGAPSASPALTGAPTAPTPSPGDSSTLLATTAFVAAAIAAAGGVTSFNNRTGAVVLTLSDLTSAGGAPIASPALTGTPTAPTAAAGTATDQLATTAFVMSAIGAGAGVTSFNGRSGAVTLDLADITGAGGAPIASPSFTGTPTVPTATPGTSNTQAASTAFVTAAIAAGSVASFNGRTGAVTLNVNDITGAGGAPLASPALTGTPSAPTAAAGTSTTQIATTAFVQAAIAAGSVTSFNGRTGAITLTLADVTGVGGAPAASPAFTGTPTAPTAPAGTNTTQVATTAFVTAAMAAYVPHIRVVQQVFTSSGTYTASAGMQFAIVECVGGGGSGGPAILNTSSTTLAGGGGGSGGYSRSVLSAGQIGASQPVTIGAGGAASTTTGNNGSTTSFGSLVNAQGGGGGEGNDGGSGWGGGGGGAGPGVGQIVFFGSPGTAGFATTLPSTMAVGGTGGCMWGGSQTGAPRQIGLGQGAASGYAGAFGAGGSGAARANNGSAGNQAGGAGGAGWCAVTEFCF
jgi:hypothetical protein